MAHPGLAKLLPHPLLMRLFHVHYRHKAKKLTRDFSKAAGVPLLNTCDLGSFRRSDTVFILGSGPSVNAISKERWEAIARHDTIGFNLWPVHDFVPRIFVFESVTPKAGFYSVFMKQMKQRAVEYRDVLKIVTEMRPLSDREQLGLAMAADFRENYYALETVPVVSRTEEEFAAGLDFVRGKGAFARTNRVEWMFKYGGSVVGMISLAIQLGYKQIVLCGIDLGPQEYFYQDEKLYPHAADWEFVPRNEPHLTTRRLPYLVPAQQVLWQMKRVVLDPAGVGLFVENSNSTLYPKIPKAPDTIFA